MGGIGTSCASLHSRYMNFETEIPLHRVDRLLGGRT